MVAVKTDREVAAAALDPPSADDEQDARRCDLSNDFADVEAQAA